MWSWKGRYGDQGSNVGQQISEGGEEDQPIDWLTEVLPSSKSGDNE